MSGGISPNKLNDISKVYLDMVTDINKKEQEADAKRWTQKEETGCKTESPFKKKKVKEDYESQKKKEVLAAMKKQGRKLSSKDKNKIADKVVKDKGDTSKSDDRYAYEGFSNWRKDLREVTSDAEATEIDNQPEIKEKKVKNKIKINPEFKEAVKQMGGELLEVTEVDDKKKDPKADVDAYKEKQMSDKEKKLKLRILRVKMMAAKQGADSSIVAHYEPDIEGAVEYFFEEGINEEGIDQLVEEIGLDEFVNFIEGGTVELNEERAARKMNVRTLKATQKKAEEIKASKKDVVKRGTPADTLARARTERAFKKPKLAKPAPKKEAPKPVVKKVTPKKAEPAKKAAPAKKPAAPKKPVTKKVVKAVAKVKKTQPAKKASKPGIRQKIATLYKRGVKRHRKATQPIRVLHKGMKSGARKVLKVAKDVRSVTTANKSRTVNMQSYEPEGDTLSEVQVTRVGDEQHKAMQDAVLKRKEDLKKKAKKKVKEEFVDEGKLTSVKATTYGMPSKERKALIDKERERQGVKPKPTKESLEVQEKVLDKFETGEKERIVKGMKKSSKDLKKRYGDKWKSVMYATATKKAKEAGDTSKSDKRYAYEETQIDELNRYAKETGKNTGSLNKRAGSPVRKGGSGDKALQTVQRMIRQQTGKPPGQQKKVKGKKPPVAGEYGARRSPEEIVKKRRWDKERADAAMRDTSGT